MRETTYFTRYLNVISSRIINECNCRFDFRVRGIYFGLFYQVVSYCFSFARPRFPQLCSRWTPVMRASGSVHVLLRYTIAKLRAWWLQVRVNSNRHHHFANLLEINVIIFNILKIRKYSSGAFVDKWPEASRDFTVFWSWLAVEVSINYEVVGLPCSRGTTTSCLMGTNVSCEWIKHEVIFFIDRASFL